MSQRLDALRHWLTQILGRDDFALRDLAGDASFRRYFRVEQSPGHSWVVMDAPPEREDSRPYLDIARRLGEAGLHVPAVEMADLEQGFLLLEDLGDELYVHRLKQGREVERLYGDALGALAAMQACVPAEDLPSYSQDLLLREMHLFNEWLLPRHLGLRLDPEETRRLEACYAFLSEAALAQPRVFVHRDYHSRNLLVCGRHNPGMVDFQDAVHGPVTYDLISLLRDFYVVWPRDQVEDWAKGYLQLAVHSGILPDSLEEDEFMRWFDLMALQRQLKVAGIFARLWHRDGKPGYLADIPTALRYLLETAAPYPEMDFLRELVAERVLPAMLASLEKNEQGTPSA